jgi:hypothetical protein
MSLLLILFSSSYDAHEKFFFVVRIVY